MMSFGNASACPFRGRLTAVFGLFFSICAVFDLSAHVIENDTLRITFGAPEEGYAITSIESKMAGGARFIHADASTPSNFWAIVLSAVNSTGGIDRIALDNHVRTASKRIERNGDETRFVWAGIDLPGGEAGALDVMASVALPPGEGESVWRLSVENRSAKWALHDTAYPMLKDVVRPGEADVLMPYENLGARLLKKYNGKSRNRQCQWGEFP